MSKGTPGRGIDTWAKLKLYRSHLGYGKEFWHGWYTQSVKSMENGG